MKNWKNIWKRVFLAIASHALFPIALSSSLHIEPRTLKFQFKLFFQMSNKTACSQPLKKYFCVSIVWTCEKIALKPKIQSRASVMTWFFKTLHIIAYTIVSWKNNNSVQNQLETVKNFQKKTKLNRHKMTDVGEWFRTIPIFTRFVFSLNNPDFFWKSWKTKLILSLSHSGPDSKPKYPPLIL